MAAKKYVALWDFENEYEGKVKIGDEITLNDERSRELRIKRMVRPIAQVRAIEKAEQKEQAAAEKEKKK